MTTKLDKSLKREIDVNGEPYTLTISPEGLKLVPKGKRNGVELRWEDLVSGQAALAVALNASIERLTDRNRRATTGRAQAPVTPTDGHRRASKPAEAPAPVVSRVRKRRRPG